MATLHFDYNALRDDHPSQRWQRFWLFLLDISLLIMGAYFLYRYWTAWVGHSSLLWWWLLPAILCILLACLGLFGIWRRGHEEHDHPERYVRLDDEQLIWWLDLNETPQQIALADIKNAQYDIRDVTLQLKGGGTKVLHTYLIMAPAKETAFRAALKEVIA